jgi:hypothetical protein
MRGGFDPGKILWAGRPQGNQVRGVNKIVGKTQPAHKNRDLRQSGS